MQSQNINHSKQNKDKQSTLGVDEELELIIKYIGEKQLGMKQGQLQQLLKQKNVDNILGCLFGSFIGDSLGSYCQFQTKQQSLKNVSNAMKMVGQGPFFLYPGQVTDDSEMALHMLIGLLHYNKDKDLESQVPLLTVAIAKQYIQWLINIPFDIGYTCRSAIQILKKYVPNEGKNPTKIQTCPLDFEKVKFSFTQISKKNHNSLSNGFLMRIAPLVCFSSLIFKYKNSKQDNISLKQLIRNQANMTHSNTTCINANFGFIQFLVSIINRNEHNQLLNLKKQLTQTIKNSQQTKGKVDQNIINIIKQAFDDYNLNKQKNEQNKKLLTAACQQAGYFKIAYYYSFYTFFQIIDTCQSQQDLKPEVLKKALKLVIQQGGDTDTNACIVGALIGSIIGFSRLPKQYLVKMLKLRLGKSEFRLNEKTYEPINGFINLIKLYKKFA